MPVSFKPAQNLYWRLSFEHLQHFTRWIQPEPSRYKHRRVSSFVKCSKLLRVHLLDFGRNLRNNRRNEVHIAASAQQNPIFFHFKYDCLHDRQQRKQNGTEIYSKQGNEEFFFLPGSCQNSRKRKKNGYHELAFLFEVFHNRNDLRGTFIKFL